MITIKKLISSAMTLIVCAVLMSSCTTPKNVAYFQDLSDVEVVETSAQQLIKVKPEDKLSIVVKSKDPALSELFNLNVYSTRVGQNAASTGDATKLRSYTAPSEGMSQYTVSPQGTIDFPVLGTLKVAGMTRFEVAGFIKGELMGRDLVKDPTVTVEFINTGISVLGSVKNPGRYDMNRDHLTVFDAIALAGDLELYGQRTNVLVIRRNGDKVESYRINLTDGESVMKSPVYYLQQDDMIYVEPNGMQKRSTTNNANNVMNASFWVSIASALASIAVLIFK